MAKRRLRLVKPWRRPKIKMSMSSTSPVVLVMLRSLREVQQAKVQRAGTREKGADLQDRQLRT
jgi:hypothetical protein